MAVERTAGGTSLIDVLDRVLDKGIVIDAWVRVSLVGIDLLTVEASRAARTLRFAPPWRYSTPAARRPSKTILVASAWVSTRRLARFSAGRR
jgi:hypothetical protein